jgi:hypothetical protein
MNRSVDGQRAREVRPGLGGIDEEDYSLLAAG